MPHSANLIEHVTREVEMLHVFFVAWFSGLQDSEAALERGLVSRLAPDFMLIQPGGERLGRADLVAAIRAGQGKNPEFRIAIRNVVVQRTLGDYVLATYEEWQRNARASRPHDNGRIASVLLRRAGDDLVWCHVHETWLPAAVMLAGPYDF